MNIVVHDPNLSALLGDLRLHFSPDVISCVKFRSYTTNTRGSCRSCRFCAVSDSLLEVASIICRILGSGYKDLNVFFVVGDVDQLHSTFVLDYLRSLYSLVILTYSRYKKECGLYTQSETIGILHSTFYNLNLLPIHDWKGFLKDGACSSVFSATGNPRFIYLEGCKYMFDDFYAALEPLKKNEVKSGKLVSCSCSVDHRTLRRRKSIQGSSFDNTQLRILCSDSTSPGEDNSPGCRRSSAEGLQINSQTVERKEGAVTYKSASDQTPKGRLHSGYECNQENGKTVEESVYVITAEGLQMADFKYSSKDRGKKSQPIYSVSSLTSSDHSEAGNSWYCEGDSSGKLSLECYNRIRSIDCMANYEPSDVGIAARDVMFFENVMFCGTFDCLHFGHKYMLLLSFLSCGKSIQIGITGSDSMLNCKSDSHLIQSYEERLEAVEEYVNILKLLYRSKMFTPPTLDQCSTNGNTVISYQNCDFFTYLTESIALPDCEEALYHEFTVDKLCEEPKTQETSQVLSVTTFKLMDIYGPAGFMEDSYALVVSPESLSGAKRVNEYRCSHGLQGWPVLSGGFVFHPEHEATRKMLDKISSSRIRSELKVMSARRSTSIG
ncbi:hypothetical protein BgAZ_108750 [Babesia gibsoni]|uniref:Cytidyltransferase-like domain-containing protein n=1 Tax=Babesia gibsoni TaxID=33632 RepID=A0AAD8PGJ7_BABGI|nr:hypothetical protein BgAZ_108750 [Babesia gibsoni]